MSEQIREQVSAFLDGELPDSETELLLKRLTRDGELRESFGRYALVGEAIRGASQAYLTKGFAGRVNLAIDGEPVAANGHAAASSSAAVMPPARLTNYVFAHSRYSSGLDQRGVLADLLIEADEQQAPVNEAAAHVAP